MTKILPFTSRKVKQIFDKHKKAYEEGYPAMSLCEHNIMDETPVVDQEEKEKLCSVYNDNMLLYLKSKAEQEKYLDDEDE